MAKTAAPPPAIVSIPRDDRFRPRGDVKWTRIGVWRTIALIAVHVGVIVHVAHWKISGETLTPMEPSEAMQTLEIGYVNAGFFVLVGSILLTALVGRFFCGWVCHFVAYQDLCAWLLRKLGLKPKPVRSRLLVLVPFWAGGYMFLWPTFERWWRGQPAPKFEWQLTTERFWETFPGLGMAILSIAFAGFFIVYWLGAKGFCTYGCPYGAFFGLADRVAPLRVKVTDACETCGHCTTVCSSNVRVHEEVARYRMVVDPGCMKTMDCVNSCPKDALYLGVAFRPLRAKTRKWLSPGPDFTWPEEFAMAFAFVAGLLVYRDLYGEVPFLLAISIGVVLAASTVLAWRLWRRPALRFQHHDLRVDGRLTRAGKLVAVALFAVSVFTLHGVPVQYAAWRGESLSIAAGALPPGSAQKRAMLTESADWLSTSLSLGLFGDAKRELAIGFVQRDLGQFETAEGHLRRALELRPEWPPALVVLADVVAIKGDLPAGEAILRSVLAERPDFGPALQCLQALEARRAREGETKR